MKNSLNRLHMNAFLKSRFWYIALYFIYWLAFFLVAKAIFLLYHIHHTAQFNLSSISGIFYHGLSLDLSATGYIILLPHIVLLITSYFKGRIAAGVAGIYTLILLVIVLIFTLADLEVYKYWGIRLDNTALRFLSTPKEMLASVTWPAMLLMIVALITLTAIFYFLYHKLLHPLLLHSPKPGWKGMVIFLLLSLPLIIIIRGGTGISTLSLSRVYFHSEPFPNHAAINVVWNLGHSLLEKKDIPNPYQYMDDTTALAYVDRAFREDTSTIEMLKSPQPNIIFIILESYTGGVIGSLGGLSDVTPNFNSLSKEGILFDNFFANDSRTDKSLVSIFSGYPALGKISIIKFPEKTQKLGNISREMDNNGYHTAFYYGGDIDFANIRSYLVNGHFNRIISADDIKSDDKKSRWGYPDHVVFDHLLSACDSASNPFFKVFLTLSNHEPFDIPVNSKFGRKTFEDKFCSAAAYVDSCIGDFISKAKRTEWWNNTLIVMLADHGIKFPLEMAGYDPNKYHIPMLWTGGAIKTDTVISKYCSQSDLSKTLLKQLGISTEAFPFSKDIFSTSNSFAFYEYSNSFGMIADSGRFVFDNNVQKIVDQEGVISDYLINTGKAIQQKVYDTYLGNF